MDKIKVLILLLLTFSIHLISHGQSESKVKDWFNEGEFYFYSEDYLDALNFYLRIDTTSYTNANIKHRIGLCYLFSETDYEKAIHYLKQSAKDIAGRYNEGNFNEEQAPLEALFYLGKSYQYTDELDSALSVFHELRQKILERDEVENLFIINNEIQKCHNAIDNEKDPRQVKFVSLGSSINDRFSNTHVVVSPDGTQMAYISKRKFYDALFYTKRNDQTENTASLEPTAPLRSRNPFQQPSHSGPSGNHEHAGVIQTNDKSASIENEWGYLMNITPQIGSEGDFYPCSFSHDGKVLFLKRKEDLGENLYYSVFIEEENSWSKAQRINNRDINTVFGETHASMSADSTTLYFASYRDQGFGELDLYKATMNSLGVWSNVENLGATINTPFDENKPFISPDGQTLYFLSKGHYNIGGYDIFYSRKDENGNWGTPENLGYPVNTTRDDEYFSPSFGEDFIGYISKYNDEQKKYEIHKILPIESMADTLFHLNIAFNNQNDEDIEIPNAQIIVEDLEDSSRMEISTNETNKGFSRKMLPGDYLVTIYSNQYEKIEKKISIPGDHQDTLVSISFPFKPKGQKYEIVSFSSILFGFDKDSLTGQAKSKLDKTAEFLHNHEDLKLLISGHTDNIGSYEYNKKLSLRRAKSAANYLVSQGVDTNRLVLKGHSYDSSIALNEMPDDQDFPEGRKYNRRVDFHVLNAKDRFKVKNELQVPDYMDVNKSNQYTVLLPVNTPEENRKKIRQFNRPAKDYLTPYGRIYYVGSYNTKSEAESIKEAIEKERLAVPEIIRLYELEHYISGKKRYTVKYTVQVSAMQKEVEPDYFTIENVKKRVGEDGLIRYTKGQFDQYEAAKTMLDEIKEAGYPEAFISTFQVKAGENEPED